MSDEHRLVSGPGPSPKVTRSSSLLPHERELLLLIVELLPRGTLLGERARELGNLVRADREPTW